MPTRSNKLCRATATTALLFAFSASANAYSLYKDDGSSVDFNVEIGLGLFNSEHAYAQVRSKPSSPTWGEGYAKYGFSANYKLDGAGSLYGKLNLLSAANRGDGDAAGFSTGDEADTAIEDAFIGWHSGDLFPALGHNGVDLSFGSQNFVIGDGFLINGDSLNFGDGFKHLADQGIAPRGINRGGAYWLAARRAFSNTAVLKLGTDKGWRAQAFWLSSNNVAQAETSLAGFDLQYADPNYGTLAATYLRGLNVDSKAAEFFDLEGRDGQDTYALRGNTSLGISSLMLRGEYVFQNDHQYGTGTAHAWYTEGSWTFAKVIWSPGIDYRFSRFSDGFDPLFYGFNRGYGTWFQGEVAGNYAGPFNTDSTIQQVKLTASPRENLSIGALYFNYSDTQGDDLNGHEIDLYAQWSVNTHLMISPVLGFYDPEHDAANGGTQLGGSDTNFYQQVIAVVTF